VNYSNTDMGPDVLKIVKHLQSELVICTKDRPEALTRALVSILDQTVTPNRVLVVDSSVSVESEVVVKEVNSYSKVSIFYVKSIPGLTHQRNVAVKNLLATTELVHFIDDDVILRDNYLEGIVAAFKRSPEAIGVGGAIENLPVYRVRLLRKVLGLDSNIQGSILRNGYNVICALPSLERQVDWLSGCSMSFRRNIFTYQFFDERRTGNGMGEDVDFCLRAKNHGKLVWTPDAKLIHDRSPINRLDAMKTRNAIFEHRLMLAADNLGGVLAQKVRMGEIVESVFSVAKVVTRGDFHNVWPELRYLFARVIEISKRSKR
jgi:GT2 family glycosyltransferase